MKFVAILVAVLSLAGCIGSITQVRAIDGGFSPMTKLSGFMIGQRKVDGYREVMAVYLEGPRTGDTPDIRLRTRAVVREYTGCEAGELIPEPNLPGYVTRITCPEVS